MPSFRSTFAPVLVLVLVSAALAAQTVPATLNYQGRLTDNTVQQNPLTGTVNMQFEIWDVASGGTVSPDRLWLEPASGAIPVAVTNGVFSVALGGNGVPIPATVFTTGTTRWLQIIANGETLGPRQAIAAAGYANQAQNASFAVSAGSATSATTAGNSAQLGGVAAASWQRSLSTTACPAGQFYNAVAAGGTAGCATVQSTLVAPLSLSGSVASAGGVLAGTNTGSGSGVYGENTTTLGSAFGVHGRISAASAGAFSAGVRGQNLATGGSGIGVWGSQGGSGWGVYGTSVGGYGVYGAASAATGANAVGVYGSTSSATDTAAGVRGAATAGSGAVYGVYGSSASTGGTGAGVYGIATGTNNFNYGVQGVATASSGGVGVLGQGRNAGGQFFIPNGLSGGMGVFGAADGVNGWSVFGTGNPPSSGQYGGYFGNNVHVSGTLEKGAGSFMIDHPLDPGNKYLYHSFVESPDMMNLYNGNVVTDATGEATIELPKWFEALNRDFRYQLTVIGEFAQAIVAKEIAGNRFTIRTSKPRVKVSWQVTGVRHDAYAEAHRIPVERDKPAGERGSYLHPELFGQPEEKSYEWATHPEQMRELKALRAKASPAAPPPAP